MALKLLASNANLSTPLTSPVPISEGGTGQTSATLAFNALAPSTSKGDLLVFDGTSIVRLPAPADGELLVSDSTDTTGLKWKVLTKAIADGNSGVSKTIDFSIGTDHTLTLDNSCTLSFTAPVLTGSVLSVALIQGGGGSKTVTWPGSVVWPGGVAPTLTLLNGKKDIFLFRFDGTNYFGMTFGLNY